MSEIRQMLLLTAAILALGPLAALAGSVLHDLVSLL